MSEERLQLKNQALLERLQKIVAEYEERDADRRVDLTYMDKRIKELEEENSAFREALETKAAQTTVVRGEVVPEEDEEDTADDPD